MTEKPIVGRYDQKALAGACILDKSKISVPKHDPIDPNTLDKIAEVAFEIRAQRQVYAGGNLDILAQVEATMVSQAPQEAEVIAIGRATNWFENHTQTDIVVDYFRKK